jgi:electron transfer flavoprotein alpha subunit
MSIVISCFLPGADFDRSAEGLLGAGQRLATELAAEHVVLAAGAAERLIQHGTMMADRVVQLQCDGLTADSPESVLAAVAAASQELSPQVVLLAGDSASKELAPRLGFRLGGCSLGDAQALEVVQGTVRVTRSVYGGKAIAIVAAKSWPAVISIRARAFPPAVKSDHAATLETSAVTIAPQHSTRIVARHIESASEVNLEDAAVIVSGGRGLAGPEPFEDLRQLAKVMKAEVSASRAACDAGWVPPGLQVGQTGKRVAPELYVAVAISGASQHLMGIADAKVVAAINTDSEAPIFKRCQFGIVEDWKKVIGPLTQRIDELL